ncbi:MAG: hypothetical protein KC766_21155, partial [Myxococcales bacterium]|nr:hypothetical protein [Myxococcales bacterium]
MVDAEGSRKGALTFPLDHLRAPGHPVSLTGGGMPKSQTTKTFTAFHLFCGMGGGAMGFAAA